MKIINLLRSEFVKNYNIKRFIIITIVLIIASLLLTNIGNNKLEQSTIKDALSTYRDTLSKKNEADIKTLDEKINYQHSKDYVKYMEVIENSGVDAYLDYRVSLIQYDLLPLVKTNFIIKEMNSNMNDNYIVSICNSTDIDEDNIMNTKSIIYNLCNKYNEESREDLYQENLDKIKVYEKLLKEGKYYKYLEYQIEQGKVEENEFTKTLISGKQENSTSYQVKNYYQYQQLEKNANLKIMTEDEYNKGNYSNKSYENYKGHEQKLKDNAIKARNILIYSTKNSIKHDISYNYEDNVSDGYMYRNTKTKVNQVFHLSIVIAIILCITSGKIVSGEHSRGTIKNIITAPVRRWKILLSKFIYMIIDAYVLWFLGLFIISIISGIKYGFSDLLTPKLIFSNGNVIEVNYFLYLIKDIFIASIPLIAFISIIFFLSTISLNTSLTVGVTSALASISACLWLMSMTGNIKEIVYTPLWYLDLGFIFNNSSLYIDSLRNINYSVGLGIIISIVFTIVLYLVSNFVYIKRDIKN